MANMYNDAPGLGVWAYIENTNLAGYYTPRPSDARGKIVTAVLADYQANQGIEAKMVAAGWVKKAAWTNSNHGERQNYLYVWEQDAEVPHLRLEAYDQVMMWVAYTHCCGCRVLRGVERKLPMGTDKNAYVLAKLGAGFCGGVVCVVHEQDHRRWSAAMTANGFTLVHTQVHNGQPQAHLYVNMERHPPVDGWQDRKGAYPGVEQRTGLFGDAPVRQPQVDPNICLERPETPHTRQYGRTHVRAIDANYCRYCAQDLGWG